MALCGRQEGRMRHVVRQSHQSPGRRAFVKVVAFPSQAQKIEISTHMFTGFSQTETQFPPIEKVHTLCSQRNRSKSGSCCHGLGKRHLHCESHPLNITIGHAWKERQ